MNPFATSGIVQAAARRQGDGHRPMAAAPTGGGADGQCPNAARLRLRQCNGCIWTRFRPLDLAV
jgi:hypothetical protein